MCRVKGTFCSFANRRSWPPTRFILYWCSPRLRISTLYGSDPLRYAWNLILQDRATSIRFGGSLWRLPVKYISRVTATMLAKAVTVPDEES